MFALLARLSAKTWIHFFKRWSIKISINTINTILTSEKRRDAILWLFQVCSVKLVSTSDYGVVVAWVWVRYLIFCFWVGTKWHTSDHRMENTVLNNKNTKLKQTVIAWLQDIHRETGGTQFHGCNQEVKYCNHQAWIYLSCIIRISVLIVSIKQMTKNEMPFHLCYCFFF